MAVRDTDKGWQRIKEDMRMLKGSYTKVGLPQDGRVGNPTSKGSGTPPVNDMSELVIIGAVHEYGSQRVPMRSFLRSTTDENRGQISQLKEKLITKIYAGAIKSREALSITGEFLTTKVKQKIVAIKIPPLSLATVKRKGSTNPLVDTGQLVQSIQHKEVIK